MVSVDVHGMASVVLRSDMLHEQNDDNLHVRISIGQDETDGTME